LKIQIAVLLSGRGSNFKAILNAIQTKYIINAEISLVVSNNIDAPGLVYADAKNIETLYMDKSLHNDRESFDRVIIERLQKKRIDLVCLAGYMMLISPCFVNAFKNRIMNIHPSLLPSFPGLNAQKQALEYGVKVAGCTVHFVDDHMDHGPIIAQSVVIIEDNDTEDSLSKRILEEEHRIYPEAVKLFVEKRLLVEGRKVKILGR